VGDGVFPKNHWFETEKWKERKKKKTGGGDFYRKTFQLLGGEDKKEKKQEVGEGGLVLEPSFLRVGNNGGGKGGS